jgi:PAS domain S-box-containing protein
MARSPVQDQELESLRVLAAERDRLARTLEGLATAVFVTDAGGRIVDANPAAARISGFESVEDMLCASSSDILSRYLMLDADGGLLLNDELPSRQVALGESTHGEVLMRVVDRATGDEHWRMMRSTPLVEPDGRRLAVNSIEDVTAAKQAELRQAFLARAGEVLASSLDYEETLRRVARLAVPMLADWCGVDILDDRGLRNRVAVHHQDPAKIALAAELDRRFPPDPAADTGVYRVLRTGAPEVYSRITDELITATVRDEEQRELILALGMRSLIIAPMKLRGRTIGAITLVSSETQRSFADDDLDFAMEVARRAAVAVENARLYTSRTEAAKTLQQSLLPERLDPPAGWLADALYRPGDDLNEVGGDFFDLTTLDDDGGLLAFVGDVTGKGVQAAALTSLARHTLMAGARFDPRPAALMRLLENVLNAREEPSPVTVAAVRLTPTGEGAIAHVTCAGHPPPLLLRGGGPPEPLGVFDVLLGTGLGRQWRETKVALRPGDTLLLYTDGVIDTPGCEERFGEQRLSEVAAAGPLNPAAVLERIDAATTAWQSGRAVDDRAMLALQLAPARDA